MGEIQDVLKADNKLYCVSLAMALLVWPPALVTFVVMTYRSYKNGKLL